MRSMTSMTSAGRPGRGRARRYPPELWRVPVLRTAMVTPAMAPMVRRLPATAEVTVLIEVADAAEEQPLPSVTWLHRDGRPPGTPDLLLAALRAAGPLGGDTAVWAAGERTVTHAVRAWLL